MRTHNKQCLLSPSYNILRAYILPHTSHHRKKHTCEEEEYPFLRPLSEYSSDELPSVSNHVMPWHRYTVNTYDKNTPYFASLHLFRLDKKGITWNQAQRFRFFKPYSWRGGLKSPPHTHTHIQTQTEWFLVSFLNAWRYRAHTFDFSLTFIAHFDKKKSDQVTRVGHLIPSQRPEVKSENWPFKVAKYNFQIVLRERNWRQSHFSIFFG